MGGVNAGETCVYGKGGQWDKPSSAQGHVLELKVLMMPLNIDCLVHVAALGLYRFSLTNTTSQSGTAVGSGVFGEAKPTSRPS